MPFMATLITMDQRLVHWAKTSKDRLTTSLLGLVSRVLAVSIVLVDWRLYCSRLKKSSVALRAWTARADAGFHRREHVFN